MAETSASITIFTPDARRGFRGDSPSALCSPPVLFFRLPIGRCGDPIGLCGAGAEQAVCGSGKRRVDGMCGDAVCGGGSRRGEDLCGDEGGGSTRGNGLCGSVELEGRRILEPDPEGGLFGDADAKYLVSNCDRNDRSSPIEGALSFFCGINEHL